MTAAISFAAVSKTYHRGLSRAAVHALTDISFEVPQGEAFGFIGPNGAGKSTTIKILVGSLVNFQGEARLLGNTVRTPSARRHLAYVPENPALFDYLTPLEILQMGCAVASGRPAGKSRQHCLNWLERFGIADVATRQLRTFSKGMAQRCALAHALALEPKLLILDEPLSGLDPVGRREVVEILADYKKQGGTIFLTSHVLHDVERLADRFGLINKGRLVALQSPGDVLASNRTFSVRSLGATPVTGVVAEGGGRWLGEVNEGELWSRLDELRTAGHRILEVRPAMTLEAAFFQAVDTASSGSESAGSPDNV